MPATHVTIIMNIPVQYIQLESEICWRDLCVCDLLCRPHDVRNSIQHGTNRVAAGQDRHRADGLQLRAAVYASHDPRVSEGVGCARR